MDLREGVTNVDAESDTNLEISIVVTQSQSSPTQRKNSQESDSKEHGRDSDASTVQRKNTKKYRRSDKKESKDGRRNREEKRIRKKLKRQEKRKRKERKKKRRRESIDQQQFSTNVESVEADEPIGSTHPIEASMPIKKRKINSSVSDSWGLDSSTDRDLSAATNGGAGTTSHDPSYMNEEEDDINEDLDEPYIPTKSDAESSDGDEKNEGDPSFKNKIQSNERRGRSRLSISNRHSPRTWNERFEALINFKLEHGHTNVPSRNFYDRGLAEFVCQIKNNPNELNDEQKDKLRDLGFEWITYKEKKEKVWNENLYDLEQFYKKHKSFAVHTVPELKKLHRWLLSQRTLQRNGRLREDRKERLEGIGYTDWASKIKEKSDEKIPDTWIRQYNNLKKYFRENGHSMVPQHKHTQNHEQRSLGNWVRKQRTLRNNDCLSAKKIDLLEKLDFVWTFNSNTTSLRSGKLRDQRKEFDNSLNLLAQYKKEHGSIDGVRGSMMMDDRNVGKWLSKQKSLFRSGVLPVDRKARLEELGVVFDFI